MLSTSSAGFTGMVEMEVVGVAPEPNSNKPLVWLKDKDQKVFLPISIGNFEATAIYMELYNESPPRPICYDLVKTVLGQVDATVERILISDLKDDTFYAQITLRNGDEVFDVDSRPSDAIALALRLECPIFAADSVLEDAGFEVNGHETPAIWEDGVENVIDLVTAVDEFPADSGEEDGSRVVSLKERLKEAVSKEEYEKAAKIRDELGRLDSPIEGV
jgi:bifunctional DNase/RNase